MSKYHDTVIELESPVPSLPNATSATADDNVVIDKHKDDVDSMEFSFEQYIELQIWKLKKAQKVEKFVFVVFVC